MASPQTVAELLGGAQATDSQPPPPPGFVASNDQPPPPPGFVPKGAAPSPSVGQSLLTGFGKGARDIVHGGADVLDFVPDAAKALWNLPGDVAQIATGHDLGKRAPYHSFRDASDAFADRIGLPRDQNAADRILGAGVEGATAGAGVGGALGLLKAAPGGVGAIGEALAAHPIVNAVAGASGGSAAQTTGEAGGGPIAQLAAGTVASMLGGMAFTPRGSAGATAVAERFGPAAAKVVSEVPKDVVISPKGELTPEGQEIAAHNNLHPDQVKAAYDHFDEVQARTANDNPDLPPPEAQAQAVGDGLTPRAPTGEEPPQMAQEAPPVAPAPQVQPEAPLPSSALARATEAQSEGVDLTKGQATQDFATQEAENTLKRTTGTPESAAAQTFYAKQQGQISDAVDRFKAAFGDTTATAEERGQQVQDALRTLRDQGKAGVTSLYQQAKAAAEALGQEGSNLVKLDTAPILAKLRELFIDESVPDQVRKALKQMAAKHGLIGSDPTTVEGETTVKLKDNTGQPSGKVSFTGPVDPLDITNAEAFRQKVNALYQTDTSKLSQGLKPVVDEAVQQAVERAAREAPGGVGQAFKTARAAHAQQMATFKAKDAVQQLIDWKKGAPGTPAVSPDAVVKKVLGSDADSVTSLKKVKAILLSGSSENANGAWQAIQAHAVAKIFDKALTLNANPGEGITGTISGAKLNSAIHAFGVDKLKILLPQPEFDQLMKLNRIVRNATVPIDGTVNHSGSAYAIMNFIGKQGLKLGALARHIPGAGMVADVAAHVVTGAQQAAKAQKTLKGVREFDLTQAANEDAKAAKPNPAQFLRDFIATAGTPDVIGPLLAAGAASQPQKDQTQ